MRPKEVRVVVRGQLLLLALIIAPWAPVRAQDPGSAEASDPDARGELVDRVVAIVGDSAIFYSQVQEQLLRLRAAGATIPEDAGELREFEREALDDLVNQMLVLNAAIADTTITVEDELVDEEADLAWEDALRRFGSEVALSQSLDEVGLSAAQWRSNQREEIRRSMLMESYVEIQRRDSRLIPVEEEQMREFFAREEANLGERPATLTFTQVVFVPSASDSVRAEVRRQASELLTQLDEGADFEDLARRFSDDPGSAPRGGELGWVRLGTGFVQEFEEAAFSLERGERSGIVDTQFGSHIIMVDRIRGPERMVRHILVAAEPTQEDVQRTRARAIEIRSEVAGGASLVDFEDEGEDTGLDNPLTLTRDQLGQLPAAMAQPLSSAAEGEVIGPIEIELQPGQPTFAVAQVEEVREAGQITFEDVRDQISSILRDEQFRDQLLERLRAENYVAVRW